MIDDIKKIQINLGKNFNDLKRIMDSYLNELPEEAQKKINPIRTDINKIMKEVKNGNVDAINKITDKYANISR